MKVFFDTNVILDALLKREPFYEHAAILFRAIGDRRIEAFVSATSVKDSYYLIRKETKDKDKAFQDVQQLLKIMKICTVNRGVLERAVELSFKDFEDAIQVASAEIVNLDVIVTRNIKDFKGSSIPALPPEVLINQI